MDVEPKADMEDLSRQHSSAGGDVQFGEQLLFNNLVW